MDVRKCLAQAEIRKLPGKDRILVALDVSNTKAAIALFEPLAPHVGGGKIGLELHHTMTAEILTPESEEEAILNLRDQRSLYRTLRGRAFWDGKFDDISATVGAAAAVVGKRLQMSLFNVHASAGIEAMMAAVRNKGDSMVLAVTVLTSREENDANITFNEPVKAKVIEFAREAVLAGVDGIVCSPQELAIIRSRPELADLITVVPGTRSAGVAANDQKRVMTPKEAIIAGADFLVAGRQLKDAASPVEAVKALIAEIEEGLAARAK